jgi:hypothetical protein
MNKRLGVRTLRAHTPPYLLACTRRLGHGPSGGYTSHLHRVRAKASIERIRYLRHDGSNVLAGFAAAIALSALIE